MELVKDEKLEVLGRFDNFVILVSAREDEVEHHVVCEQDVGRILFDGCAFALRLLARIALNRDEIRTVHELPDLLELAVRKRVHRIDDYRTYARRRVDLLFPDDSVHNRNEERKGLAGASARRDDKALVARNHRKRCGLVAIELDGLGVWRGLLLAGLEYLRGLGFNVSLPGKFVDERAFAVVGIDLNERVWPEAPLVIRRLNLVCDVPGSRGRETRRELLVVLDQSVPELKNVVHRTRFPLTVFALFLCVPLASGT